MRKNSLNFPVEIVDGAFRTDNPVLADMIRTATGNDQPRVFVVADLNVVQRVAGLGAAMGAYLKAQNLELAATPVVLGGGEKVKEDNFASVLAIAKAALEAHVGVKDVALVLGGGTVLDVAGYALAQIRGGIKIVRVPTTPTAMVDAAFAETASVDSPHVKDAYTVSCVPAGVVIDPKLADTVLDGVWRGGFAAAVRYACVSDGPLVKRLAKEAAAFRDRKPGVFAKIVADICAARQKKGDTPFARWSAERLEAMSGYKLPYGYAVAIGTLVDAMYARERTLLDDADFEIVQQALTDCGAMEGAAHSRHLLEQAEAVLRGLDAWELKTGARSIVVPTGPGKASVEENVDLETMKAALDLIK